MLELASLIYINGGDLTQLAKFRIGQNRKYQNVGLSPAAAIGVLGFVFTKVRHFIGVGRV